MRLGQVLRVGTVGVHRPHVVAAVGELAHPHDALAVRRPVRRAFATVFVAAELVVAGMEGEQFGVAAVRITAVELPMPAAAGTEQQRPAVRRPLRVGIVAGVVREQAAALAGGIEERDALASLDRHFAGATHAVRMAVDETVGQHLVADPSHAAGREHVAAITLGFRVLAFGREHQQVAAARAPRPFAAGALAQVGLPSVGLLAVDLVIAVAAAVPRQQPGGAGMHHRRVLPRRELHVGAHVAQVHHVLPAVGGLLPGDHAVGMLAVALVEVLQFGDRALLADVAFRDDHAAVGCGHEMAFAHRAGAGEVMEADALVCAIPTEDGLALVQRVRALDHVRVADQFAAVHRREALQVALPAVRERCAPAMADKVRQRLEAWIKGGGLRRGDRRRG